MGRTKQLLPWQTPAGNKPLIAAAYDAIRGVCCEMIVVVGHEAELVVAALADRRFQLVTSDPDAEMFESIRAGLAAAQAIDADSTILLQPGDHPEVAPATLTTLAAAHRERHDCAIMPEFRGSGGHPVFIPPTIALRLISEECPDGLAQFWRSNPHICQRIQVTDSSVVRDVDTPDQVTD